MFENTLTTPSENQHRYCIEAKLGEGRSGAVYLGFNANELNTPYAIKFPTITGTSKQRANIITQQVQAITNFSFPHTVKCIDFSLDKISPYIVLEYIPETLQDNVNQNKITQNIIITYLQQTPIILQHLHQHNKVHGDLKPANIGIHNDILKVLDFELIQPPGPIRCNKTNLSLFHPPELHYANKLTTTSDTYMIGKTLEYLLTNQFSEDSEEAIDTIELYHDIELPSSFKELLTKMTHHNPEKRITPNNLPLLTTKAIEDLQQKTYFSSQNFTTIEIPYDIFQRLN